MAAALRYISPSRMNRVRSAWAATSGSWVISTMVRPRVAQAFERGQHLLAGGRVQVAGGLVGQDERRAVHERPPRNGHALDLPARQLVALALVELLGQGHRLQGRARPRGTFGNRAGGVEQRQHDVAQHGGARQQVERLEHEAYARGAHLGQLIGGEAGQVLAL